MTGIVHLDDVPVSPSVLGRMTRALAHRGPDGEGMFVDACVGLGHTRLAVIDLTAAGHQPMATPDGRFVLSYNGEIYNFLELRIELEAKGHRFRSRTDSEVVLTAWAEWGTAALDRFNGMFAFAIYDRRNREVTLCRDRYGVKPLYLCRLGEVLLFGSEIKAFIEHPRFTPSLDEEGLVEYLTFQNFLGTRTLFHGVEMVPPGTRTHIRLDSKTIRTERWWDYRFEEPEDDVDRTQCELELTRLIEGAVSRQLISDVPVGTYLSGGIDTGAIASVASRQLPVMHSYTVGFDLSSASGLELAFDERQKAERMSYLFGTEHYEMVLKAGDMERCMPSLTWHLEEPRVGQSYPNYYAARLASRFGKVVLSGSGGDELFAGYPWRYYAPDSPSDFGGFVDEYYAYWQRLLPTDTLDAITTKLGDSARRFDPRVCFRDVFGALVHPLGGREDAINRSLYFEARTFLHGLLVVEDKLSMAFGLETRVPLLDNDLVDFALRVPTRFKLGIVERGEREDENTPGAKNLSFNPSQAHGKKIFRDALVEYVPADVLAARKQGFSAPDASWFRGESIDYVRRTLLDRDARIYSFLERKPVQELVEQHIRGEANRRLLIWSLLSLENWIWIFLEGHRPNLDHAA